MSQQQAIKPIVLELEQGSDIWHQARKKRIGASEAPAVLGVCPWTTRYQLWCKKTGREYYVKTGKGSGSNFAIDRGNRFEPVARSLYELTHDLDLPPVVLSHPNFNFLLASLDGYNEPAGIILEIKIPGAEVFELAKSNVCHPKYWPQVQMQLMVADGKEAHFFCCKVEKIRGEETITDTALVIVKPDLEYQATLIRALTDFWNNHVLADVPPALSDGDTMVLEDDTSVVMVSRLKQAKYKLDHEGTDSAHDVYDLIREEVLCYLETFHHSRFYCIGVSMTHGKNGSWRFTYEQNHGASELSTDSIVVVAATLNPPVEGSLA